MAVTVTHPFVSAVADGADATVVRPSNWNATHSISGTLDVANGGTGVTSSTGTGSTVLSALPTFAGAIVSVTDNTNAALRITQLGTGNALLVEDSTNPDATPVVIDATGRTTIGATQAYNASGGYPVGFSQYAVNGESTFGRFSNDSSTVSLDITKSRGTSVGTQAIVQSGDSFGRFNFAGSDGANYIVGARIEAYVDGTPGTNDMPGRLVFSTTADGASSPTERMRISSTGLVTITNGAVIQGLTVGLGANAVANNTVVGASALGNGALSGGYNVAIGSTALNSNTTGIVNTSVGASASYANTIGGGNTAVGASALYSSTSGSNNLAIGYNAGNALTTGSNNTIIGSVVGTAGLSDTVIIAAGSAERMRIDSTGLMKVPGGISGGTF